MLVKLRRIDTTQVYATVANYKLHPESKLMGGWFLIHAHAALQADAVHL